MEKTSIKVTFDDGRKWVSLDRRAIRKSSTKDSWLKEIAPATKGWDIPEKEVADKLGKVYDEVKGTQPRAAAEK